MYTIYHTPYNALLLLKGWVSLGHRWKSSRQGSTACQDWTVFIVSSQKENVASTKIKNKIAKTEYFFSVPLPTPEPPHPPPSSVPPSPPDDPENFSAAPPIAPLFRAII